MTHFLLAFINQFIIIMNKSMGFFATKDYDICFANLLKNVTLHRKKDLFPTLNTFCSNTKTCEFLHLLFCATFFH